MLKQKIVDSYLVFYFDWSESVSYAGSEKEGNWMRSRENEYKDEPTTLHSPKSMHSRL